METSLIELFDGTKILVILVVVKFILAARVVFKFMVLFNKSIVNLALLEFVNPKVSVA